MVPFTAQGTENSPHRCRHTIQIAWRNRGLGSCNPVDGQSNHPACVLTLPDPLETASKIPEIPDTLEEKISRLRAVLFLAKEPLPSRKLSQYSNLADGTEARTLVTQLNRQFDENGRAFRAEFVAGGYQLVTRPQFAKWLRRLEYVPGNIRLSTPAMETLAVVAYRQPVQRSEVEAIRGVGCGEMLAQLLNRDFVRISGRSEELGRPYLYSTTKRFLMIFGLRSLEDLPRAELFQDEEPDQEIDDEIALSSTDSDNQIEANEEGSNEEN